ncbi:MAG: sigma-70 family RNA polymerase sigma factor, partial [Opitutaceae bacterium]
MNRDSKQVLTEWLVLSAQGGSESAFKDLHDLWRGDLRRLALMWVERPEVADEITNDVWLAIARGLHRLDDPACFPRWAFRIAERRSADWIRQRSL